MAFNAVANFQNVYLRIGSSANEMTSFTLEPYSATLVEGDQLYYIVPAETDPLPISSYISPLPGYRNGG